MYYGIGTQSRLLLQLPSPQCVFFWTIDEVNAIFFLLFVFCTTWQTSWNEITLFCDGLNIEGHLPCAVKKALAGAAALSCPIWIKPKSRGTLSIHLALPPIITARKHTPLHKMINSSTQIIWHVQAFVVGHSLSFMAYFKTITRDMIVRQAGSKRISDRWIKDIQNSFSNLLLIEF